MAAKKKGPFTFTAISYVISKSGDGSVRRRQETVFEQAPSAGGICRFRPIKRTSFMMEAECIKADKTMMEHAGTVLSDYLSNNRSNDS